jgi:hypothetical protein
MLQKFLSSRPQVSKLLIPFLKMLTFRLFRKIEGSGRPRPPFSIGSKILDLDILPPCLRKLTIMLVNSVIK